jgi:acyl-[acyl-carrier-protein]-phospholipid O-acyltransferase/long-chain-fatty-acid--[acyl-carrier-protein] ligase
MPRQHREIAVGEDSIPAGTERHFNNPFEGRTLFQAFADACRRYGGSEPVVEDAVGGKSGYRRILTGARIIARRIAPLTQEGEAVAVLLPNANGVLATFLALQSAARVPAMLNYTAGPSTVLAACDTVKARLVISSRAFVEKAGLEPVVDRLSQAGLTFFWLEDLQAAVGKLEKALAWLLALRPMVRGRPEEAGLILFTSGSEGLPKGVILSHRNVLSNCAQIATRIEFGPRDKLFNVLPVFHSFGITGGMILPLLYGVRLYLYPSPLHFKIIPQAVARVKPTIMFGTDTFLNGYARTAKDSDFASLRMVVAGAEAVKDETRLTWAQRFDTLVLEGFGMTEASPVVAVNSPHGNRPGSVGQLLPGIEYRLEPVEGIADGGRLWLRGPNVMMGYMTHDRPGELQTLDDGWHDSGDIVALDSEGFVSIKGRAKRFAKVAGEMVSLGAIELMAKSLWPEENHAVVTIPDIRRGERIVLITTAPKAERDALIAASRQRGYTELWVPNAIIKVLEIPVLGSGKTDYASAKIIALGDNGPAALSGVGQS